MKNKLLAIIILAVTFLSCDDKLDLSPEDQLTLPVSFSNKTLALGVLNGIYSASQQDDVLNGTWQLAGEWQSDNVNFVGSFPTFNELRTYTTLSDNTSISGMWDDRYESIGTANLVIKYVPLVEDPNFTDSERANAIAQAKFMRALLYFDFANWFSQPLQTGNGTTLAVPLVLEPFDGVVNYPSRATLNEVFAQVEQDLLSALPNLDNTDNSKATRGACLALLARLYLYQDRFPEAADYANQAIQEGSFALASDYTFYDTVSNEFYFTLVNTAADGQDSGEGFSGLSNPTPGGRGDAPFSQNLLDAFAAEPGDKRFTELTQVGPDAIGNNSTFTSKFPEAVNNSDNAPVLRVTEMYLTRAEANFRAGSSVGDTPLNDINALRSRAGLSDLASVDLDAILLERRKELCFEGHRRMDLLRNNMNLRRAGMANVSESAPGQNKVILPIPVNQLDLNENLTQNPGY
ncbi:RagB/SusD family nutrient uptake outer membrane protein [Tenacibaculum discolor]|uniref:RagB/SusD family nutrient uptake outer membrane protein n=1 Tax=Tenacibaculum discolor TaxID=361581 RepID=UPI000F5B38B5|nr:RagB/SusD family nutrient uptake outer membrane protein [Tenacibaculum discolor]